MILAASWWSSSPSNSAGQSRIGTAVAARPDGTPVSQASDPLDGSPEDIAAAPDPLDAPPSELRHPDVGAPDQFDELPILRSGRSRSAPDSSVAYDGDRSTAWPVGDPGSRWVWFDLGESTRIRELRWLTTGSGAVSVELSNDRERWRESGDYALKPTWSGAELREDARYVRLSFSDNATDDASLVEFAAYGQPVSNGTGGGKSVELAQEREQRASERKQRRERGERRPQRAADAEQAEPNDGEDDTSSSGLTISTKPGKTKCKGDKAKCRANEGRTRVEDDCASEGSCVIDVRADGGTAICDASGGDENETGQGEGKKPGRGGRCEATADGGAVTIGDINP